MGRISADSIIEIRVDGPENGGNSNFVRYGGSISYKLFDENYPFDEDLPTATCE